MKEIKRQKIPSVHAQPGDTIILSYAQRYRTQKVLEAGIKEKYVFDEAVIFEVEEGDFQKVKRGLGGAFLESDRSDE